MDWNLVGYVLAPFIAFGGIFGGILLVLKYGADFLDWLDEEDK